MRCLKFITRFIKPTCNDRNWTHIELDSLTWFIAAWLYSSLLSYTFLTGKAISEIKRRNTCLDESFEESSAETEKWLSDFRQCSSGVLVPNVSFLTRDGFWKAIAKDALIKWCSILQFVRLFKAKVHFLGCHFTNVMFASMECFVYV